MIAEKELVVKKGAAAEGATAEQVEAAAQPIIESLRARLNALTEQQTKYATEQIRSKAQGLTGSDTLSSPRYRWFDMLMVGPFSFPFLPSPNKIIPSGTPSFMICVLWRNPAPIGWIPGPSAANVMAGYTVQVRLETINLSAVTNGPDFVPPPIVFNPVSNLDFYVVPLTFPVPAEGNPQLYEINMTADVIGPGPGHAFAGYSTWVLNTDDDLPFLFLPYVPAGPQHDVPARVLVYTP
jgi:hypothetical protein